MERPSYRSLPAVRRKRRAEALLLAALGAPVACMAAIGTALHPLAAFAVLFLGVAAATVVMQRETARGMRQRLVGAVPVTDRAQAPVLWDAVHACAQAAGISPPKVFLLEDFVPIQAASWGIGADRSIGMRQDLARRFRPDLIKATVGHEMAHLAMGDQATTVMLQIMRAWLRLAALALLVLSVAAVFGADSHKHVILVSGALVASGMSLFAGDVALMLGIPHIRYRREFAADAVGVALTGNPGASIALLIFFALATREPSVDPTPRPGRTHPPPLARVQAIIADHPGSGYGR